MKLSATRMATCTMRRYACCWTRGILLRFGAMVMLLLFCGQANTCLAHQKTLATDEFSILSMEDLLDEISSRPGFTADAVGVAAELGYRGDCRAVEPIRARLAHEWSSFLADEEDRNDREALRQATLEASALTTYLLALGFLARHCEDAWVFLCSATEEGFWIPASEVEPLPNGRAIRKPDLAAHTCIKAMGISGRPEVPALFRLLRDQEGYGDYPFVDAAFLYDLQADGGVDSMRDLYEGGLDRQMKLFKAWLETDNGREWSAWRDSRRGALDEGPGAP